MYQDRLLKSGKIYTLDIMFTMRCEGVTFAKLKREIILKSIIMDIIQKVRIEKAKPKLSDILQLFKSKDGKEMPLE